MTVPRGVVDSFRALAPRHERRPPVSATYLKSEAVAQRNPSLPSALAVRLWADTPTAIAAPTPTATVGWPVVAAAAGERTGTGWPATREKKWPSCFAAKRSGGAAPESTAPTTSPSTGGCGGPDPPVAAENPDLSTSSDAPPSCSNRRSMARAVGQPATLRRTRRSNTLP